MKIRTNFVTTSSSSSFILARKSALSQKQKDAIIAFVEREMLGSKILSTSSKEEEIQKAKDEDYFVESHEKEIRAALADGKDVYQGYVVFEDTEYHLADLYQSLWEAIREADETSFEAIDDSLEY